MMKHLKRLSALLIAMAIFFTGIPASAFYLDKETLLLTEPKTQENIAVPSPEPKEEAHILSEITSKRESNAKYYRMSDGSISAAVYPFDVHYADSNGIYQDIDNTLTDGTDDGDNVYASKNNNTLVKFIKKSNQNKLYTLNKGEYKIKTAIKNVNKVDAVITEYKEDTTYNQYALDKLSGQVTYFDILPDIDIQYTYTSTMLKENIILKKKTDINHLEYTYHVNGGVDVVQNNDKSISVFEKGTTNLITEITAPTLWDSAGNYSESLTITLIEAKNSQFTVKLDWVLPENAVYPVTIDPVMNFTATGDMIQDTHITTYEPNKNYDNNNHIRVSNRAYALVQYPLPTLQSGDKIINAQLVLTPYCMHPDAESAYSMANSYNPPVHVTAHAILRPWLEETATYNNINPENGFYDSTVTAYRVVNGDNELYTWDVTRLANEWADGYSVNNGILLKFETPAPSDKFNAFFLATNGTYVSPSMYPAIIYQYINTTGIEDYLSCHTYDVGYAGTVYTNDLTGNVTLVNPIVQTGGNVMPITVSMVYNLDSATTETPYGRAWCMNWSQRLYTSPDYNHGGLEHVKYCDADGTERFFIYDPTSGLYIDEINPDRKMSYNPNNGLNTMTDSSGYTMEFSRYNWQNEWYLTKVTDPYGNYITATLNPSNYEQVTKIQSSTGNVVDFVYSQSGFLVEVKYYDGNAAKSVYIDYNIHSGTNGIGRITYADNTSVEYYYSGYDCYLTRVDDIDDYHVDFGYTSGNPCRVNSVKEYSTDGTLGFNMSIKYEPTATYFNDITNARQYLYSFAKNGTLKSAVDVTSNDGNGYGTYYEYNGGRTDTLKGANNLTFVSKTQKSTVNILQKHSFETDGYYNYTVWGEENSSATGGYSSEKSYIGARSYKLTRPTTSTCTRILGYVYLWFDAGVEYTLSAYVNTSEMTSTGGGASLYFIDSGAEYESEVLKTASNEWQRLHITFTPRVSDYLGICMSLSGATGSAYFDCIQLEKGGLSDYNMIENAGFEADQSGWNIFSEYGNITQSEKIAGSKSAIATANINKYLHYNQVFSIPNGKKGDTYVASAFAKAESVPASEWQYSLLVRFLKSDWTPVNECNFEFNSYSTEWQKVSGVATATGDYYYIQFWLLYYGNCNTVYFDNAQFIKDTFGNTYTYDDNGNLISTVDLQGKEENTFSYDGNNQLIKQTNVGGGKIYYGYDLTRPTQLDFVSSGGVTTQYTYDSKGNVTQTNTHGNELTENSYYYIRNLFFDKYLDVCNYGNTNGTSIGYHTLNEDTAQRWRVIKNNDGTISLEPKCSPGMLLSVETSTLYDRARVALYNVGDAPYQKFIPVKVTNNTYRLDIANNAFSLDGEENGCYAYYTHGNEYQQYLFILVENHNSSANPSITSSATYTSNGEYMSSITDSRGKTTSYTYNESRGYVTSETNPKNVTTNYSYNGSELLTGVSIANGNAASSVSYNYDNGKKLSSIVSPSGTTYSFTYDGFARNVATKVGNRTLSSYTYNERNLPQTMTYGNGVVVSYGYDSLNRQTEFYVNNALKYKYSYDGSSRLSELIDLSLNRKTKYEYDILGRPTSEKVIDSIANSLLSKLNLRYDDTKNRLAGYDVTVGGTTNSIDYVYGGNAVAPDLITGVNRNGSRKISYTYDGLNRLSVRNLNNYLTEYTYLQGANTNSTTTLVSSMKNGDDTLSFTYDELGNITSISKNGTVIESYTYDNLNQLKTVTRGNDVYTYNYDNGGNILSVTKNGTTTKTYTYGDSEWRDLLTAYNGNAITYDNIGNPLTYYDGSTFSWSDGRKLTGVTKGTDNISYTYDSNGLRASKNVNGVLTEYYWLDGTLYAEKTGNRYIYFHYDDNGIAYGFTVNDGTSTDYYYIHNLQGDVIGIVDNNGTKVVEYTYDEWGKILAITGSLATTIGTLNPLRYRGYYYDAETDFYYCRARYYDPEICRWISADGYVSTGQGIIGYNMFAYCGNNPITLFDPTGKIGIVILGVLCCIGVGVLFIPSSEKQEATQTQIDEANKAAGRAKLEIREDKNGNPATVDVHIDTKDVIDNVDNIADDYFYQSLYDRTVEEANKHGIPTKNLMSIEHIRWEFELHELAYYFGFGGQLDGK